MNPDYPIEAMTLLLDQQCITEKYAPLIPLAEKLLAGCLRLGCRTKSDAQRLSDADCQSIGLPTEEAIRLFRRFLTLYDLKPQKFKEQNDSDYDPKTLASLRELYCLPGVKQIRATLYFLSGYRSLSDLAHADALEILEKTKQTIEERNLSCSIPLPKEVRTHIAVAKAFTFESQ